MNPAPHERTFFRLTQFSIAVSMGILAGFVWSIQEITPTFRLKFSTGVMIAFFLGAIMGWAFWKTIWNARNVTGQKSAKAKLLVWAVGFVVFIVASFPRGLRGHTQGELVDFAIGTSVAIVFLSVIGFLLFRLARYFQENEPK